MDTVQRLKITNLDITIECESEIASFCYEQGELEFAMMNVIT